MRTEQQMMALILGTAQEDPRILAAYMNGSRTNPNAPQDIFQDYDVMYVVEDTTPFREDDAWIDRFGQRLYMQYPEDSTLFPGHPTDCYGWLIQFTDGNRLDLHVETLAHMRENILKDSLCRILLDKTGILPPVPPSTDRDYWIAKPTQAQFWAACNEFWWCLNNLAKGLWREELPYAMDMLNLNIRPMLTNVLEWKAGLANQFAISAGKSGKYLYRWLPQSEWECYLRTYPAGESTAVWDAVFTMCGLFDSVARQVADGLGFSYNTEEATAAFGYLKHVRALPRDAKEVY